MLMETLASLGGMALLIVVGLLWPRDEDSASRRDGLR